MNASAKISEKPAMELCEEATFLLRHAPAHAWAIYFAGTGPFLLALLYFWTDMTRGVFHESRLIVGSFSLTILFVWMKTCQSMFAARLWSMLSGAPRAADTPAHWAAVALAQARFQPWGILIIPLSLIMTVPAGWVLAYYQNVTALGSGRDLHTNSLAQARLWPKQNHIGLSALAALGFVVFLDVIILLLAGPQLLTTFFGVKTIFQPSIWLALNTTFLALVLSLTYLMVDPLIKAFYTIRCFYGQSLASGEDLRSRLAVARKRRPATRRMAKSLVILALVLGRVGAAEAPVPPTADQLERRIVETLQGPEYNWRLPREIGERAERGWLFQFFSGIVRWLGQAVNAMIEWALDWLRRWANRIGNRDLPRADFFSWPTFKDFLVLLFAGIIVFLAVWFFKRGRKATRAVVSATATVALPDLADEQVGADQLPEDEWLKLSAQLAEQGDLRLAIRALFLSALASIASRNWIALARSKSNRDYEREVRRRAATIPGVLSAFRSLIEVYNRIWYGVHEPTRELLAQCQANLQTLRQ